MTSHPDHGRPVSSRRRVSAVVALRLLEVMREHDLPGEILEAEDPAVTMPRRLGLSEVVERQIRTYREDVRRRVRLTDEEIRDLFRLVIRRPDGEDIFFNVGQVLAGRDTGTPGWRRILPDALRYRLARRRVRRQLRKLFGRRMGGFGRGPFSIEARAHLFIESDPGGDACHFVSGLSEALLRRSLGRSVRVVHSLCQSRGDPLCRWECEQASDAAGGDGAPDPHPTTEADDS